MVKSENQINLSNWKKIRLSLQITKFIMAYHAKNIIILIVEFLLIFIFHTKITEIIFYYRHF